jgi:hypothetical protein
MALARGVAPGLWGDAADIMMLMGRDSEPLGILAGLNYHLLGQVRRLAATQVLVILFACLVPGAWCLVPGAWCLVPGAWCLVPGAWCLVLL